MNNALDHVYYIRILEISYHNIVGDAYLTPRSIRQIFSLIIYLKSGSNIKSE